MKEASPSKSEAYGGLKLNYKRTFIIGFAFFGILLLWQVYDSWCPTFLSELFMSVFEGSSDEEVQYLVGIVMAFDNLAALIMLPIFGYLSDKTHTKIGKRMPYILVGTFVSAVAFPFIPVCFHYNNVAGTLILMAVVVFFMMMYRNPAVALMPDMTPKPLRSKANGIINIMGYIGGAFATVVGIFFVLSTYLGKTEGSTDSWMYNNIWTIEIPFLLASVLMVVSAIFLFIKIKENKIEEEMKDEMARGELYAETADKVDEGEKPLSKKNKRMLFTILGAEFLWFMADNGMNTFMGNYTIYYLGASTSGQMINTIIMGVGSVIGFALAGYFAMKLGRKITISIGLALSAVSIAVWAILGFALHMEGIGSFPVYLYIIFFFKGFGMSLVHANSYPMVVELASGSKVGRFTGYYYASSMASQTITPVALGALMLIPEISWEFVPVYGGICLVASFIVFLFVQSSKAKPTNEKVGLEGLGNSGD